MNGGRIYIQKAFSSSNLFLHLFLPCSRIVLELFYSTFRDAVPYRIIFLLSFFPEVRGAIKKALKIRKHEKKKERGRKRKKEKERKNGSFYRVKKDFSKAENANKGFQRRQNYTSPSFADANVTYTLR